MVPCHKDDKVIIAKTAMQMQSSSDPSTKYFSINMWHKNQCGRNKTQIMKISSILGTLISNDIENKKKRVHVSTISAKCLEMKKWIRTLFLRNTKYKYEISKENENLMERLLNKRSCCISKSRRKMRILPLRYWKQKTEISRL